MEEYSKQQVSQLNEVNQHLEARLTRTKSVAVTSAWKRKQSMSNYQSEYDRIRSELSNSAMPVQTQDGIMNNNCIRQMGVKLYTITS